MGKKIKVVDIAAAEAETPVTNEVTVDVEPEQETVNETPPPTDDVEPVTVEQLPKPKAKPRSKKKETVTPEVPTLEEVEPVKEVVPEPTALNEAEVKVKVKKVVEQVKCPKCDKMMSQKSLRYTHEQNCKGEVVKTEDLPVKRRTANKVEATTKDVKVETNKKDMYNKIVGKNVNIETSEVQIPEELKLEVLKSIQRQQERIRMKEDNLSKLKMQIF